MPAQLEKLCHQEVAAYPPPELVEATRRRGDELMAKLDKNHRAVLRPPFVIIGDLPPRELEQMADQSVVRPAGAMWASYFRKRPPEPIAVLLFRDAESYKKGAGAAFGDKDLPHFGYYKPEERTMVMNIATGTGTLVHELTHALIVYDFPDVPRWFNEGLASLHEQCYVHPDRIVGKVNWRLPGLQTAVREKRLRPLATMLRADDFYGPLQGLNYAHSRYLFLYMQEKGRLRRFYHAFHARAGESDAAVKTIEEVFGRKIDQVDAEYVKWVKGLTPTTPLASDN